MGQRKQQKDVITRLAESGEEAMQRLAELPGGARVLQVANSLRDSVDDLTKRMRSLDPLEKRVTELERRLDELSKPKPAPSTRRTATTRAKPTGTTAPKTTTPRTRKTSS